MAEKKTIRAASYSRVSTAGQAAEGLSLDEQVERIRAFIQQSGWQLVHEYQDAGKSGAKPFRTRPAFRTMVADAVAGKFDALVVYDMGRFSKNPEDYFPLEAELDRMGVSILALDDLNFDRANDGDVLRRGIEVIIGQFTARQARAKSIKVKESKLERGEFNIGQRLPYGLRWTDKAGRGLEHDPATYPVWCFIKHVRGLGWGYGRIADALNGQGEVEAALLKKYHVKIPVPNRFGQKVWREGAIASMFADEQRVDGMLTVNFRRLDGKVKTYEVKFPPLMSRAEYKKFKAMAAKNLTWTPRNVGRGSVLSGLCRCGICGSKLHVTTSKKWSYYGCSNRLRRKGAKRCPLPLIPRRTLELRVLWDLGEFLRDDERFNTALELANVADRDRSAELSRLLTNTKRADQAAKACQAKLDRLVDAIADGVIAGQDAKRKRQGIADEQAAVEKRQNDLAGKRIALERLQGKAAEVDAARAKLRRRYGRMVDLKRLSKSEKQDLLRALLPPDTDCGIIVHPLDEDEAVELGRRWDIEFSGILPVESGIIKHAVLGGALAVP